MSLNEEPQGNQPIGLSVPTLLKRPNLTDEEFTETPITFSIEGPGNIFRHKIFIEFRTAGAISTSTSASTTSTTRKPTTRSAACEKKLKELEKIRAALMRAKKNKSKEKRMKHEQQRSSSSPHPSEATETTIPEQKLKSRALQLEAGDFERARRSHRHLTEVNK